MTSCIVRTLAWTLTFGLCHPTLIGFELVITFLSLLVKRFALFLSFWLIDKAWRHTCSRSSIGDVTSLGYLVCTQNVVTFTFCIDWHWVIDHNCKLICSNVALIVLLVKADVTSLQQHYIVTQQTYCIWADLTCLLHWWYDTWFNCTHWMLLI